MLELTICENGRFVEWAVTDSETGEVRRFGANVTGEEGDVIVILRADAHFESVQSK